MNIYPGLIASDFVVTNDGNRHAFKINLWQTNEDAQNFMFIHDGFEKNTDAAATTICQQYTIDEQCSYLGELHFVKDLWNVERMNHELLHMLFHYIKGCFKEFTRMLYMDHINPEEDICYEFQYWSQYVYRWLWKKNPNPKWVKE